MKRYFCLFSFLFAITPVFLNACDDGSCPVDERGAGRSAEARAFMEAALKAPKDYLDLEKSKLPFIAVFKEVAAIVTSEDQVPALRVLVQMLDQGRKAFSKQLVREALRQAELIFVRHAEAIADSAKREALKEKLVACINFFVVE